MANFPDDADAAVRKGQAPCICRTVFAIHLLVLPPVDVWIGDDLSAIIHLGVADRVATNMRDEERVGGYERNARALAAVRGG